jgi:hypothetical protein
MKIRKEQMDVLKRYTFDSFVARMVSHLRLSQSERLKPCSNVEITAFVRASIGLAQAYGIATEANLESFLDFHIVCGWDCFRDPSFQALQKILEDPHVDETEKVNYLNECLVFGGPAFSSLDPHLVISRIGAGD